MQSKLLALLAVCGIAVAAPTPTCTEEPLTDLQALQRIRYTVMSIRSGSPVQYASLNAIAGRLYLGGKTTSYCPPDVKYCGGPGNVTVFDGSCSLDSMTPQHWDVDQQTLWNTDDGVIGYDFSQPRPENAYNCPWTLGFSENEAFAATIDATYGANGFLACPSGEDGVWQVLRNVDDKAALKTPQGNVNDCLGVQLVALGYNATAYGAYVYT